MSDGDEPRLEVSTAEAPGPDEPVEAYESEGKTVLYEAANPLAWVESSVSFAIEDYA